MTCICNEARCPHFQNEPLERVMSEFAKLHKLRLDRLQFCFDGDVIWCQDTAANLELEDGYCIDVIRK